MVSQSTKSALADASAGVIGSLTAMLAFYPIDVAKTKLQTSNESFLANKGNDDEYDDDEYDEYDDDDDDDDGTDDDDDDGTDNENKPQPNQSNKTTISSTWTKNINKNKNTHINANTSTNTNNAKDEISTQEIKQLLSIYFRGVHYKIGHTISSSFVYFFLYSWIQSAHRTLSRNIAMVPKGKTHNYQPKTSTRLLLAAIAAMMNVCLTLPLDVLSTRSQSEADQKDTTNTTTNTNHNHDNSVQHQKPKPKPIPTTNMGNITSKTTTTMELKHYWKGLWPALLLCSNPSIHFTIFDVIKSKLLKRHNRTHSRLSWMEAFVLGLIAKFAATIITYPLILAKTRLMVSSSSHSDILQTMEEGDQINNKKHDRNHSHMEEDMGSSSRSLSPSTTANTLTMTQILIHTYRMDGVKGLYKGCNLQLLHSLLKSALLMMVRERITLTTRKLILGDKVNEMNSMKN